MLPVTPDCVNFELVRASADLCDLSWNRCKNLNKQFLEEAAEKLVLGTRIYVLTMDNLNGRVKCFELYHSDMDVRLYDSEEDDSYGLANFIEYEVRSAFIVGYLIFNSAS